MDIETIRRYLEKSKLYKLANYAVRGDPLTTLDNGEKALVAFYSIQLILTAWSKELLDLQDLLTEDFKTKFDSPEYTFERNLETTKELILLYKIDNYLSAVQLLKPLIDKYWKMLDDNMDLVKEKYKNDFIFILGYRVSCKETLMDASLKQEELRATLQSKFPWAKEYHDEAKQIAGDTAVRNMHRYISQLEEALNVEKGVENGTTV